MRGSAWLVLTVLAVLAAGAPCEAARIGDLVEQDAAERAARFFSLRDASVRHALAGSVLLGIACGVMGCFLVVRKLALMGDALAHAVLPGVAVGFLWGMTRDPAAIFVGATLAGLLGAATAQAITSTTKHKEDAALGFVLASFFAVGVCLLTMIQNLPGGNRAGVDTFLFGQAAAMGRADVLLLAAVAAGAVGLVAVFYKELVATSFDPGFARSAGMRVQVFHYALMLMLAFSVVASLQAVGVVLVSAMLVIPAATAFLLTDRMAAMLWIAASVGAATGAGGAFVSFVGRNLPTGPVMVLAAAAVFCGALFFGPRHGVVVRWWRRRSASARVARENTLKAVYRILENAGFVREAVSLAELAEARRETVEAAGREVKALAAHGLASFGPTGEDAALTPDGWRRACEIVRNHRLWELYLTDAAEIASDHVHDDAEAVEHVLGEETVRRLEKRLNYARLDPHGRLIPGARDIAAISRGRFGTGSGIGFGREEGL